MPSFRSPASQAKHVVRTLASHGTPRHGHHDDGKIHSKGTERNYEQAIRGFGRYLAEHKLGDVRSANSDIALRYLDFRSDEVSQKTLDMDRQAIQATVLCGQKLRRIKSEIEVVQKSRAYTSAQVDLIVEAQGGDHGFTTRIAENAGLRAHELFTLLPITERAADTHREWLTERFTGRPNPFRLYTVEGKGGLCREVAIDQDLAEQLERRRLPTPKVVYDRDVRYAQHYDLTGGKKWGDSYSKASGRALGWSEGAHGLRHKFAQERMDKLQSLGYSYDSALRIVSEEMGHFRAEITEVYLR